MGHATDTKSGSNRVDSPPVDGMRYVWLEKAEFLSGTQPPWSCRIREPTPSGAKRGHARCRDESVASPAL